MSPVFLLHFSFCSQCKCYNFSPDFSPGNAFKKEMAQKIQDSANRSLTSATAQVNFNINTRVITVVDESITAYNHSCLQDLVASYS